MEQKFLHYYHRELVFMREAASEFAHKHPKIAKRLDINNTLVSDPWVERLIDSFCFLNARTQLKIDAEFEQFTQRLLNSLSPEFTMPTPAMSVIQLLPSETEGELTQGYNVPAGTALFSQPLTKDKTRCEFRTRHAVTLWPFRLTQAQITQVPPELAAQLECIESQPVALAALKLVFSLPKALHFSQLEHLAELPLYFAGSEQTASQLLELLACHHIATAIASPNKLAIIPTASDRHSMGNAMNRGQDPLTHWQSHQGYQQVKAYFDCREQFQFYHLTDLAEHFAECDSHQVDIWLLLDQMAPDLVGLISTESIKLYCVPVINLFPGKVDRIKVSPDMVKYHVLPDRSRPNDYEICLVTEVTGFSAEGQELGKYRPIYHSSPADRHNYGRYFSLERSAAYSGESPAGHASETTLWLSLVDQSDPPYPRSLGRLHLAALVSNKSLPQRLPQPDYRGIDLTSSEAIPIIGANFISRITNRYDTTAYADHAWKLIGLLNSAYHPLDTVTDTHRAEHLREQLSLFSRHDDPFGRALIDSIVSLAMHSVVRRLPGDDLLLNCRGVSCRLTLDEHPFSGYSPYLFGAMLAQFFADHTSINSFIELQLYSVQRGLVTTWPAVFGRRGLL